MDPASLLQVLFADTMKTFNDSGSIKAISAQHFIYAKVTKCVHLLAREKWVKIE